jgi:hypothetical protein
MDKNGILGHIGDTGEEIISHPPNHLTKAIMGMEEDSRCSII